jgi:hypothetical protein
MITLDVDLKGLTEADVQRAIDSYISNKNAVAWRQKHEAEQRLRVKAQRVQQGLRLRVVNAIKRCGVSVATQDSWSSGVVSVSSNPNAEGWYNISITIDRYNKRDTPEKEAQYNERLVNIITKLQRSGEIDFTIETVLETPPSYYPDQTKKLVTKYKARSKQTHDLTVEEN